MATSNEDNAATVISSDWMTVPSIIKRVPRATIIALKVSFFVVFISAAGYEVSAHTLTAAVEQKKICAAVAGIVTCA